MSYLQVHGLGVRIASRPIVDGVTFEALPGSVTGIVGPNGSGKSTLSRTLYRALRPSSGVVLLDRRDIHRAMSAAHLARHVAAVVQDGFTGVEGSVYEAVMVGRTPHFGVLGRTSSIDTAAVATALDRAGATHLADRDFTSLSGGEKQRVLLARALAQEPSLLVLDEPTNHLDIAAQLDLLTVVGELSSSTSMTVVAVLHDLNLAAAACDQLLVLHHGRLFARGAPREVLTPHLVSQVFGVRAHTGTNPLTGRTQLSFAPQAPTQCLAGLAVATPHVPPTPAARPAPTPAQPSSVPTPQETS